MCSQFLYPDSVKLRFLLLIEQLVQMTSLDSSVITIAIVCNQRFVTITVETAFQDVRPDGKEKNVNKVRQ